jgi:hypothetical protein
MKISRPQPSPVGQTARRCILLAIPTFLACGSKPVHVPEAPPPKEARPTQETATIGVSSEVGALDEDAVNNVFEKAQNSMMACLHKGAGRVELLGGDVIVFVSINENGQAEEARLEHSTLGDRETESCMTQVLRARSWPKPVGGRKGQVHKSFSFDMPNDARPPVEWTAEDVEDTLKKLHKRVAECTGRGGGTYQVTAYIDTRGSAISVGVAPPDANGESKADCLISLIKGAKFKSPGSYPAKVSFDL